MSGHIRDSQYDNLEYSMSEIKHEYGPNLRILSDPLTLTRLARLGHPQTFQPTVNELIKRIYTTLLHEVVSSEFNFSTQEIESRMAEFHPKQGYFVGPILDASTKVVSVNLARAGTYPSHICFEELNHLLSPSSVRQDHISISRKTSANETVTGSEMAGHKIGGPVDDRILLIPDPMGATGSTIVETMNTYKKYGKPKKVITMHCIVTPEFVKRVHEYDPEILVYTARFDRGLSAESVLKTPVGAKKEQETGLNEKSYIVPGAGGVGEILNNAFV